MSARPHFARWREWRRQGLMTLAYCLWRRASARLHLARVFDVQAHNILSVAPWHLRLPQRLPRGIAVRELTVGDLAALDRLRPAAGLAYASRLRQGQRGWGAWLEEGAGSRLVAFVWLRRGPATVAASLGCQWHLSAAMAWVYDLYSDPGILGAAPRLYAHLREHPPGERLEVLVGQTDAENIHSRLAHRSLGYEACAWLLSFRVLGVRFRISTSAGARRRWRLHAWSGRIPLDLISSPHDRGAVQARMARAQSAPLAVQCTCGQHVELPETSAGSIHCRCGLAVAEVRDGIVYLGSPMPYWGEVPEPDMERILARAPVAGWRQAVRELAPQALLGYIGDDDRAAFADLLPLPAGARILDVGAGWGGIACPLARSYPVVALEGVAARARFISLRQRQDRLSQLQVLCGDVHQARLGIGQFDAIVANGILEWVPLMDRGASPTAVQLSFLCRLRELLAPGGRLYIGIESRISWDALRGELDHSGLPYTSLLPRPLARWVCSHNRNYRAHFNTGYRTYTYTHRGYTKLFAQAGLALDASWLCPRSYNHPEKMLPFYTPALRFATGHGAARWPVGSLRRLATRATPCRWLGSNLAFLLAVDGAAALPVPETSRAPDWGSRGPQPGARASGWRASAAPGPAPTNGAADA